jgi:hypothetical protein
VPKEPGRLTEKMLLGTDWGPETKGPGYHLEFKNGRKCSLKPQGGGGLPYHGIWKLENGYLMVGFAMVWNDKELEKTGVVSAWTLDTSSTSLTGTEYLRPIKGGSLSFYDQTKSPASGSIRTVDGVSVKTTGALKVRVTAWTEVRGKPDMSAPASTFTFGKYTGKQFKALFPGKVVRVNAEHADKAGQKWYYIDVILYTGESGLDRGWVRDNATLAFQKKDESMDEVLPQLDKLPGTDKFTGAAP